jgi:hypothetical protein
MTKLTPRRIALLACLLAVAITARDASAGPRSRPVRTGQGTCWDSAGNVIPCAGTRQDGDLRPGEPRSYTDNGDGTIRDRRTGLTWEKLSNDGTIHDKDGTYTWAEAFAKVADLNTAAFGGRTNWRLPSINELETLTNRSVVLPAVSTPFNTGCTANCTVLTCSCTAAATMIHWSSSTYVNAPASAWLVNFFDGTAYVATKTDKYQVRAVRGD